MSAYGQGVIDFEGPEPVYQQLAAILRDQIRSGELRPDRPIPSIAQLVGTYGVARGTALKATALLIEEGLVRTVRGRGTYVVRKP